MAAAERLDAVVVGAGPAGLATSHELAHRGLRHVVLERGDVVGYTWANLYESLVLHTGKRMSWLPGLRFPDTYPTFVPRAGFWRYLLDYAGRFQVPVLTETAVTRAAPAGGGWRVETADEAFEARALIVATGIVANPVTPEFPGQSSFRGSIMHSVGYRHPEPFLGHRVLIVGVGNSGGEIGAELARAGVAVTVAVRSGANVVPRELFGVPIQYLAHYVRRLPRPLRLAVVGAVQRLTRLRRGPPVLPRPAHGPLDAIPLIGFHLVDAIRAGRVAVRPGVAAFSAAGVRFTDGREEPFDDVILATGFRPALDFLPEGLARDAKGFARRADRVTSADFPGLFFVGHNYDATGGLWNIHHDAPLAAERAARLRRG